MTAPPNISAVPHGRDEPHFCAHCGHELTGGPYCPECGHPAPRAEEAGDDPRGGAAVAGPRAGSPVSGPSGAGAGGGLTIRLRHPVVIAAGVLLVVALLVGALAWQAGRERDEQSRTAAAARAAYRADVRGVYDPVRTANIALSRELEGLSRLDRTAAQRAVGAALDATAAASGALARLDVPAGSDDLEDEARQLLELERAYLEQVRRVLEAPVRSANSQVPVLAAALTRGLTAADESLFGSADQVRGVEHLVEWAPGVAARLARARGDRPDRQGGAGAVAGVVSPPSAPPSAPPAPPAPSPTPSNPFANGRSCGASVFAGPNTSCDFAFNVRDAYWDQPGDVTTVRVYSPVTGQVYTMSCAPSGSAVTCTGGNGASVAF
jgi:hypothetical protein